MSSAPKDILIFGATGLIGKFIVKAILDSKFSFGLVRVFTSLDTVQRKASIIQSLKDKGVEVFVGDIEKDDDVLKAYEGIDTVVSAVGRNIIAKQIDFIRLAEKTENIKRFFPSEYGTDIEYFPHSVDEKPHQQKLKVRAYFKNDVKRLEHTYLVTGPYADGYISNRGGTTAGGFDVKGKKAVLLGTGEEKISLTTMDDVGKLLVAALKHYDVSRNRALKVNSFTTTPKEIVAEFERQTSSKWDISFISLEDLKRVERKAWDSSSPFATGATLRRIWTEGGTLYETRDNEAIGATDVDSLQDAVKIAIEVQSLA